MSVCIFRLDDECHAAKKGHKVCKYCWANTSPVKQETLKQHMEGFCAKYRCWELADDNSDFCALHDVPGGGERGRSRTPLRATRREDTPFNMNGYSTAVLVSHINECVAELERRATS